MIQKEVGRRICSKPGDMSVLAISVQYYATPKVLFNVSKNSFYPAPKVDSAFIQIKPNGTKRNDDFFKLVKKGFSHPRKKLANNLEARELVENWLKENKLKAGERAENLSVTQWKDLFNLMKRS
jgi:16S rRNA (adenine1518-N6/adenine1519-N6)-dimethyltransferase